MSQSSGGNYQLFLNKLYEMSTGWNICTDSSLLNLLRDLSLIYWNILNYLISYHLRTYKSHLLLINQQQRYQQILIQQGFIMQEGSFEVSMNLGALSAALHHNNSNSFMKKRFFAFIQKYGLKLTFESPQQLLNKMRKDSTFLPKPTKRSANQSTYLHFQRLFKKNQFKLFVWLLETYCSQTRLTLQTLQQQNFEQIFGIVGSKSFFFIKYEIFLMIAKTKSFKRQWDHEQKKILNKIIQNNNDILINKIQKFNWRFVSFELFRHSNGQYFRTDKQVRERWENYINPKIYKGQWSQEDDVQLIISVDILGCEWKIIASNCIQTRTQHSLKNRYYSLFNRYKKDQPELTQDKFVRQFIAQHSQHVKRDKIHQETQEKYRNCSITTVVDLTCEGEQRQSGVQIDQIGQAFILKENANGPFIDHSYDEFHYQDHQSPEQFYGSQIDVLLTQSYYQNVRRQ